MKYDIKTEKPMTDEGCKAETGKTMAEWFDEIDAWDRVKIGRREIGNRLVELGMNPWWAGSLVVEFERHKSLRKKDGLYEGYFVCSTKSIGAPLDKVYRAWVDADSLSKWFADGAKCGAKDGGTYDSDDGDKGTFLRVRENKDLRMTFENPALSAPTQLDVQFQDKDGKTGLLVNHTRIQTRAEADAVRSAWGEALAKLKTLAES